MNIKENHIMAAGNISNAVKQAHTIAPGKHVEVEVEKLPLARLVSN